MFDRYTENARKVIFIAREMASTYCAQQIDVEHILLGVLGAGFSMLSRLIRPEAAAALRADTQRYAELKLGKTQIATSIDMPLSRDAETVLKNSEREADLAQSSSIEVKHLLAALLLEQSYVAELLKRHGVNLELVRGASGKDVA